MALTDLNAWIEGRELRRWLARLANSFPKDEKYDLSSQLKRASRSVTANIAEGHGRFHFQENIQFCRQARGSLVEVYDHMTVALDEGYIDNDVMSTFEVQYERVHRILNGYINYLKKSKKQSKI